MGYRLAVITDSHGHPLRAMGLQTSLQSRLHSVRLRWRLGERGFTENSAGVKTSDPCTSHIYIYIYPIYPTIMDNLRLLHCYNWWFLGDYTFYRWGSLSILVTSISGHNCRDGPQGFYDFLLKLSIDPKTILDRRVMIRGVYYLVHHCLFKFIGDDPFRESLWSALSEIIDSGIADSSLTLRFWPLDSCDVGPSPSQHNVYGW